MRKFFPFCFSLILLLACESGSPTQSISYSSHLIPTPSQLEWQGGFFQFNEQTKFIVPAGDSDLLQIASQLAQSIREGSGFPLSVQTLDNTQLNDNAVILRRDERIEESEAYHLSIDSKAVRVSANSASGIFYGVQSIRQMLPLNDGNGLNSQDWKLPAVKIVDQARFGYRGMHLDVARHFFSVDEVKNYLDLMALYKFNRFHWHLTDDQGWRIEIKQYPRLTEIGAWRSETRIGHNSDTPIQYNGQRYGGYYTQKEILEIVEYAADRYITIIPEIEMPGHASAALAAYPQLACQPGDFQVARDWGVFEDVFCPTEETFTFMQNVLTEVTNLFPGEYIHIGGDEAPKAQWERSRFCQQLIRRERLGDEAGLQRYFISRIDSFLQGKGRKLIGWDEILEGGLLPNATVMSWRGEQGGIEAAERGNDVIMTPNTYCYFDYYQGDPAQEPLAIGGNLSVKKVYNYEPIPASLNAQAAGHILGAQGNVWTEYIKNEASLQYMIFPRAAALAEVLWSPKEARDWPDFAKRWEAHLPRLAERGVQPAMQMFGIEDSIYVQGKEIMIDLNSIASEAKIHYQLDGSAPNPNSPVYEKPVAIDSSIAFRAAVYQAGQQLGNTYSKDFLYHKGIGLNTEQEGEWSKHYTAGGAKALLDGLTGTVNHNDGHWQGYEGTKLELTLDLGSVQSIESIDLNFLYHPDNWIMLPRRVEILASEDGQNYTSIRDVSYPAPRREILAPRRENLNTVPPAAFRYLKIEAQAVTYLPSWHPGHRSKGWMFIDEIILN
ncbi:MAG: family 20 glycosylhydrolase [Bacteroidia bacterium]